MKKVATRGGIYDEETKEREKEVGRNAKKGGALEAGGGGKDEKKKSS